jgi:hypothetical protein
MPIQAQSQTMRKGGLRTLGRGELRNEHEQMRGLAGHAPRYSEHGDGWRRSSARGGGRCKQGELVFRRRCEGADVVVVLRVVRTLDGERESEREREIEERW